jgi:amino acid transporter
MLTFAKVKIAFALNQLFRKKSVRDILTQHAENEHKLKPTLGFKDITAMGIAAIIGAGIFSTIGNASFNGGPAVILLFIFTAIACGFSAMCYAEFAGVIPISGSAYTYAYAAFGELIAWIIGWALIVEYAIGNIVVAISWSDYFTHLMKGFGWHIPACFSVDYMSAARVYKEAGPNTNLADLNYSDAEAYMAWLQAPEFLGFKIILDLPALAIILIVTTLIYRGVHETKNASNIMVVIKLIVIVLVIVVGAFYVNPDNWSPFAPNGITGVLRGVSSVFFAYIGFDALSTTAEECKNPKRDLPRGIIASLLLCTILYILIALVLTGMVNYKELGVGDPLAFVFEKVNLKFMSFLIAVSAIVAMAGVLLVFQNGQPRIWMSMSRDGLLPKKFSAIHSKYKTPWFASIVTGILVAIPALFMNLKEVTDLSSIGTLFAFMLVNAGVIRMESHKSNYHTGFKVPYINGKYIVPIMYFAGLLWLLSASSLHNNNIISYFLNNPEELVFWLVALGIAFLTFKNNYSLIPVLGMLSNFYLMTQLHLSNWIGFGSWLIFGLLIYFNYGKKHSLLNKKN